ncbi:MAG TPA: LemA family protein, partial [Caldithrix abyssi]|nr:LemA family protein [Caldithrix abyssi]
MKKGCLTGLIIGGIVFSLIVIGAFITFKNYYNTFVTLEEQVNQSWS